MEKLGSLVDKPPSASAFSVKETPTRDDLDQGEKAKCSYIIKNSETTLKIFLSKPSTSADGDLNKKQPAGVLSSKIKFINNYNVSVPTKKRTPRVDKTKLTSNSNDDALNKNQLAPPISTTNKRLHSKRTDRVDIDVEEHKKQKTTTSKKSKGELVDHEDILSSVIYHMTQTMGYKDVTDVKIVMEKELTASDIQGNQGRLSIPENKTQAKFLTDDEDEFLKGKIGDKMTTKDVKVIMGTSVYNMPLSRWNYALNKSKNNNEDHHVGWKYVLKNEGGQWTKLKNDNGLQPGDYILLVSFRSNNLLHFAIIKRKYELLFGADLFQYRMR